MMSCCGRSGVSDVSESAPGVRKPSGKADGAASVARGEQGPAWAGDGRIPGCGRLAGGKRCGPSQEGQRCRAVAG